MKLQFAPLCREHNRQDFDCGEPEMNEYIHHYLAQQTRNWDTTCTVLEDADTLEMIGFFTVSPSAISRNDLPTEIHSAYDSTGVYKLGRLAVSVKHQGKGYGTLLLDEAIDLLTNRNAPKALGLFVELKGQSINSQHLAEGKKNNGFNGLEFLCDQKTIQKIHYAEIVPQARRSARPFCHRSHLLGESQEARRCPQPAPQAVSV